MNSKSTGAFSPNGEALPMAGLSDDMLRGAHEIAGFLFGNPKERRKVYHLAERSRLPTFKLGAVLCARKSTIMEWVAQQEAKAFKTVSDQVPTDD